MATRGARDAAAAGTEPVGEATTTGTAARLRAVVAELGEKFYKRDDVARALVLAVLAGQHALLLGPPGTTKSELSRELTSRITGARYWEVLLSKFTDPKREVLTLVNPDAREALDILDGVEELNAQLDAKAGQSQDAVNDWAIREASPKLARAGKKLKKMQRDAAAAGRSTAAVDRAAARQKAVHARVMTEALGIDASMVQVP